MSGKRRNPNDSGQAMIIASLVITVLLISTVYYVLETERYAVRNQTLIDCSYLGTKLGTTNTMVSALANFSNGGDRQTLTTDLSELSAVIADHTFNARLTLSFTPLNSSPYQDGILTSWGSSGKGISSACVSFSINSSGPSAVYYLEYATNVSTEMEVEGTHRKLVESAKQMNVTCRIYNEGKSALASNFTLYYEIDGDLTIEEWVKIDSFDTVDYGNGTYSMSFIIETRNRDDPVLVSVHTHDLRSIFVRANVTCTET